MGNVGGRESIGDTEGACAISEFEHTFSASLEGSSPGVVPEPPEGYAPATGRSSTARRMRSTDAINEPLVGRLVTVHMLEAGLEIREIVVLQEKTLASIPYSAIRRLTWDHSRSSLKVGHGPERSDVGEEEGTGGRPAGGTTGDPDDVFIHIRVDNSLELEDELKQRAKAEVRRAAAAGEARPTLPASVYLGMFAGFTKPRPFERKRPNLSSAIGEGHLPSLKDMRRWSLEEHWGSGHPQVYSSRPRLALDAVFSGENRFALSSAEGLTLAMPQSTVTCRSNSGEMVLNFASIDIKLPADCGKNVSFTYDVVDDWFMVDMVGKDIWEPSGFELWILVPLDDGDHGSYSVDSDNSGYRLDPRHCQRRRVFLSIPDEDLLLARNSIEYFWNLHQAQQGLPLKPGSTHGRSVASMITLRGEVKAPALPTGRVDPVDLDGVELRVGQIVQLAKRTGQLNILPSPRALLGVEKKTILRYNPRARQQWERVVLHQGWLRKRGGGAVKRWVWRYFVLYDTPQGHFLAYYNDVSDVPLYTENRRERQVVDLCQVCFLRPEIRRPKHPTLAFPPNAFTVVTTARQWTLCAESQGGALEWLQMLSVAIDEDVAVVDDGEALFQVRAHWAPNGGRYGPERIATAHVGSMGMELRLDCVEPTSLVGRSPSRRRWGGDENASATGGAACNSLRYWGFTDFFKWTLVNLNEGSTGLAIQCFADDKFSKKENILLVTPKSQQLALVIEHQVEKFMSLMHLRLELLKPADPVVTPPSDQEEKGAKSITSIEGKGNKNTREDVTIVSKTAAASLQNFQRVPSMNLETDAGAWGGTGVLSIGMSRTAISPGGGNPFDFSSDEDDDDESDIGIWEESVGNLRTPEVPERSVLPSSGNPFDFPGGINKDVKGDKTRLSFGATGGGSSWKGLDSSDDKTPSITPSETLKSSGEIHKFFPEVTVPPTSDVDATLEQQKYCSFGETHPPAFRQLLPSVPSHPHLSPSSFPMASTPRTIDPQSSSTTTTWPPPIPCPPAVAGASEPVLSPQSSMALLLEFDPSGAPAPTDRALPVPPAPFSPDRGRVDLASTFGTEAWEASAGGVVSAAATATKSGASLPTREVCAHLSSELQQQQQQQFNPFASPDSATVVPPVVPEHTVSKASGKVIYEGDSMLVALDKFVKTESACFMELRYEVQRPTPGSTFSVDLLQDEANPVLFATFEPEIASAKLNETFDGVASSGGGTPIAATAATTTLEFNQELLLTCVRPFETPPGLVLTKSSPSRSTSPLRRPSTVVRVVPLPITIVTFIEPHSITADAFRLNWKALSSSDQVVQSVVQLSALATDGRLGRATSDDRSAEIKRLLTDSIGLAEVALTEQGAREDVELVAAVGVLRMVAVKGGGEGPSVGCLVGLELNMTMGATRVTVKSTNHVLAEGILKEIVGGIHRVGNEASRRDG